MIFRIFKTLPNILPGIMGPNRKRIGGSEVISQTSTKPHPEFDREFRLGLC